VLNRSIQILTIRYAWAYSYLVCWISRRGSIVHYVASQKNANAGGLPSVITFRCLDKTYLASFRLKSAKSDRFIISESL
jgi:hypothetical protein